MNTAENSNHPSIFSPPLPGPGQSSAWRGLVGGSMALALVSAARQSNGPVCVICDDNHHLTTLRQQLEFFNSDNTGSNQQLPIYTFPDWECLPYDQFSPHQDIVSERLSTLYRLPTLERGLVLISIDNVLQRLAPASYVASHTFYVEQHNKIEIETLRLQLQQAGYLSVGQVMEPGEYAVRGGIVDLYPMGSKHPYRIELFDNEIDTIRTFDPETQRSIKTIEKIELLPAKEFPLDDKGRRLFRKRFRGQFSIDPQSCQTYREISQGLVPAGIEFYLPLFFEYTTSWFDYLPTTTTLFISDDLDQRMEDSLSQIQTRFETASLDTSRACLPPSQLYLDVEFCKQRISDFTHIQQISLGNQTNAVQFETQFGREFPHHSQSDRPYQIFIDHLKQLDGRVLLIAESSGRCETLLGLLRDNGVDSVQYETWHDFISRHDNTQVAICIGSLDHGFRILDSNISLICESQIFGKKVVQARQRSRANRDPESLIRSLADLIPGDPVVHEDHGVGRYRSLETLQLNDQPQELLLLEYAEGDKLYIPILSLDLISRYVGASPETAPLHKLGSETWGRSKQKARQRAYDVAAELLEAQAIRAARKGFAYSVPEDSYAAFSASFPFEETPDQEQAINDVLNDMRSDKAMDRLVCGDVGFGKTEVALRAAFMAIEDNRQVAILVPTTLLAQQHYANFCDRFADLPVKIEILSRFRTASENVTTLENIKNGQLDIVIGTHRLLQADVDFRQLGLVIIDEEHRFGVRQKERFKKLRSQVDLLTLTATPIPRTLNFAMSGLRDISIIATPPRARLAVKTFVRPWNEAVIYEACTREIRRGGQIYFLYNQVQTIEKAEQKLSALLPDANIKIAHGQMRERELEQVMSDFYHQKFNILLCSTIIESGIDVPNANTILINRADKFGLAQLHQLRGRVGRSHHQAYAFLLIPSSKHISGDAKKRLQVIESLEELGAGFALASHDLEIRGAGELLGEAQSGAMVDIGFSLYSEYLDRAIASIRNNKEFNLDTRQRLPEVELGDSALLPEDFIPDVQIRLGIYKRLTEASDASGLDDIQAELIDRFGLLPDSARRLLAISLLRLRLSPTGIENITLGETGGKAVFNQNADVDPAQLIKLIQNNPHQYRMKQPATLIIQRDMENFTDRLLLCNQLIDYFKPE